MSKNAIAIFGGSFNPPTVAHIEFAKQILKEIENIEKVIFVPVSTRYNKSGLAPDEKRLKMLNTVCDNEPYIEVSSIELESPIQLYTIETLKKMQEENPNKEIYFVLGTDNLKELETWHTPNEILKNFKIIVLERGNDVMEEIVENSQFLKKYKTSFIKLEKIQRSSISSSDVRKKVKNGESISGYVPEKIENEVIELYK